MFGERATTVYMAMKMYSFMIFIACSKLNFSQECNQCFLLENDRLQEQVMLWVSTVYNIFESIEELYIYKDVKITASLGVEGAGFY